MFRSIRRTLQIWHALLLLLVVCIFGSTLYLRLRLARFQSINAELQGAAEVLAARVRPAPPPPPRRDPPPETLPVPVRGMPQEPPARHPEAEHREGNRKESDRKDGDRKDGDRRNPPGEFDPVRWDEFERRFDVPEALMRRFEGDEEDAPYFVIWRSNGQLLRTSKPLPEIPHPGLRMPHAPPAPPRFRQRGHLREVIVPGPFCMQVLVGRSIEKEQSELRQLVVLLLATAAGVTIVGLLGGWLLSKRAVRPIQAITSTAQSISASNLSRRINLTETESELGTLADVLNAMFARLEAAFERQVRFTADASHELRTPLAIISSHAELALSKPRSEEEYRDAIDACFRASKRMKSLVESLLTLARADAGKLEMKCEQFDLSQAVQDCVELIEPLAAKRKVQLTLHLQTVPVSGDAFRISEVITNLLTNAIHYNREAGSVTVTVKPEDSAAVLTVSDTGVGIAEEDQKHLFERFYRVDKARSRELGGSGLGLAICKSIVEAHGGSITFTSALNKGTTFEVRLYRSVDRQARMCRSST
ncbi:MAG: sensor histidine kinase [Bacillota bacterium]